MTGSCRTWDVALPAMRGAVRCALRRFWATAEPACGSLHIQGQADEPEFFLMGAAGGQDRLKYLLSKNAPPTAVAHASDDDDE